MIGLQPDEISCLASFRPPNRTDFYGSDKLVLEFFTRVFDGTNSASRTGVIPALDALRAQGVLTREQAAGLARMLWVGATATTNLLVASALMLLVRYPEIQRRLRAEHGLVSKFLAEVLRLESPSTIITRTVQRSGDFFGADLQLNDVVKICVLSANSDPAIFVNPLEVNLDRPSHRQLEFGFGAHFCPGANIARELAETAVSRILRYSSSLTAAEDLSLLAYEEGDLRALKRLRIRIS
jgi:cytochrome P450